MQIERLKLYTVAELARLFGATVNRVEWALRGCRIQPAAHVGRIRAFTDTQLPAIAAAVGRGAVDALARMAAKPVEATAVET